MELGSEWPDRGRRLKDERTRLGLNQTEFGRKCDASKRTQIHYEKGERKPSDVYWIKAGELGVDVPYVMDGTRTQAAANTGVCSSEWLLADSDLLSLVCLINKAVVSAGKDVSDHTLIAKLAKASAEVERKKKFSDMTNSEKRDLEDLLTTVAKVI